MRSRHLVEQGHRVVNGDLVPLGHPDVADLRIDLTDAGQVFNALSAYAGFDELEPGTGCPALRRRRPLRRDPGDPRPARQRDVPGQHAQHVQRHRRCGEVGDPQGDLRQLRDDLRDLLRRRRGRARVRAGRRGAPDGSPRQLRDVEGRQRGNGTIVPGADRHRHLRVADQQRDRTARVRDRRSRRSSPTRACGAATSSPTSTPATSATWSTAACAPTASATRSSTSSNDDTSVGDHQRRGVRTLLRRRATPSRDGRVRDVLRQRQGQAARRIRAPPLLAGSDRRRRGSANPAQSVRLSWCRSPTSEVVTPIGSAPGTATPRPASPTGGSLGRTIVSAGSNASVSS